MADGGFSKLFCINECLIDTRFQQEKRLYWQYCAALLYTFHMTGRQFEDVGEGADYQLYYDKMNGEKQKYIRVIRKRLCT